MSDREENNERRIIEAPSSALQISDEREKSPILSEMASSLLVVAAESGLANLNPEELVRLGKKLLHKDGSGNTVSNIKAFGFFHQAARTGHPEAEWLVYCCIREGDGVQFDYPTSIEWLKKAAVSGSSQAQFRLTIYYLLGEESPPDFEKAKLFLHQSADQGNLDALALKGHWGIDMCYDQLSLRSLFFYNFHDVSITQNEKEYFQSLAMSGDPQGQYTLSLIYRLSRHEKSHYEELAEHWAHKSAKNGFSKGCIECREIEKYLDACLTEDPEGMALYGNELQKGKVREELKPQCIYWFKKSAELNFPNGIYYLARSFKDGICVERNESKAIALLEKLVDIGHAHGTELYLSLVGRLNSEDNLIFKNQLLIEEAANKGHVGAISLMIYITGFNTSYLENKKIKADDKASVFYSWVKKGKQVGNLEGLLKAAYCLNGQGKYIKSAYLYTRLYKVLNSNKPHNWYLTFIKALEKKISPKEITRLNILADKEINDYGI